MSFVFPAFVAFGSYAVYALANEITAAQLTVTKFRRNVVLLFIIIPTDRSDRLAPFLRVF